MKVFITGINGFVGQHLYKFLKDRRVDIVGLQHHSFFHDQGMYSGDINDQNLVASIIQNERPDGVIHLAGGSSIKKKINDPEKADFLLNVKGTKTLLDSIREHLPQMKILIVSSGVVYDHSDQPLAENSPIAADSPYGKSRIAQEALLKQYQDLHITVARSFNHTGPGEKPHSFIASICRQVVDIEKGLIPPTIFVGNLNLIRDFSDVRDVIAAYWELLQHANNGEYYNVGSGKGFKLQDIVEYVCARTDKKIEIKVDPARIRVNDNQVVIANIMKILNSTTWQPQYDIYTTIEEMLITERNRI